MSNSEIIVAEALRESDRRLQHAAATTPQMKKQFGPGDIIYLADSLTSFARHELAEAVHAFRGWQATTSAEPEEKTKGLEASRRRVTQAAVTLQQLLLTLAHHCGIELTTELIAHLQKETT